MSQLSDPGVLVVFYQQQAASKDARIAHLLQELQRERTRRQEQHDECGALLEELRAARAQQEETAAELALLRVQVEEQNKALGQQQAEANGRNERSLWLSRMLKKSQEDARAMASETQLLKESVRALGLELEETKGKFGMLGSEALRQVIEQQQTAAMENGELQQRLIAKSLQVQELTDMLAEAHRDLDPVREKAEALGKEAKALAEENVALKSQVVSLQSSARELRAKQQAQKAELCSSQQSLAFVSQQKEQNDAHLARLQEELQAMSRQLDLQGSEKQLLVGDARLAVVREDLLKEDLQIAREEKKAKDKQIRELRDNLSYLNEKIQRVMPLREQTLGKLSPHLSDDPSIHRLREQLGDSIAACRAHQSQNGFLAQEISRLQKEKMAHLEQKDSTIARLSREVRTLRAALLAIAANPAASPADIQLPAMAVDVSCEDLKTQLETVKKDFFFALLQSIKLQAAQGDAPLNLDATKMYSRITKQDVPYPRWAEWINFEVSRYSSASAVSYVSPIIARTKFD